MHTSPTVNTIKYVGLDVHGESIAVAVAEATGEVRSYGNIPSHTHALDKLHKKLSADGATVHYIYEAGPTGFWLARHLRERKLVCQIVSPSLIPKRASDRVKTDRRDALALARLYRAGELTFVHVPDQTDEAIRDLVRTRLRAVEDLRRCRQRIKAFLLRYGRRYSGKSSWTTEHLNYLSVQKFELAGQQLAFEELVNAAQDPAQRLERLTLAIEQQVAQWSRLPMVKALMSLRGFALIHAATWVAEIGDFNRFEHPTQLMSFIGITPSEDSSGKRRLQGSITKAGNDACRRAIVEAAWQYRLPARITPGIRARHAGLPKAITDIAWKAQTRLCERYLHLLRQHKKPVVIITALGRELAGFVWAIARAVDGQPVPRVNPQIPVAKLPPGAGRGGAGGSPVKAPARKYVLNPAKKYVARTAPRSATK